MKVLYDHVSLTVSSVDRSIEFYKKHFGFELARKDKPVSGELVERLTSVKGGEVIAAFVTDGNLVLEFVEYTKEKGPEPVVAPNQLGSPHLGFVVDSVLDAYAELKAEGVSFYGEPVFSARRNSHSVMLTDPDGIAIELRESRALESVPL